MIWLPFCYYCCCCYLSFLFCLLFSLIELNQISYKSSFIPQQAYPNKQRNQFNFLNNKFCQNHFTDLWYLLPLSILSYLLLPVLYTYI